RLAEDNLYRHDFILDPLDVRPSQEAVRPHEEGRDQDNVGRDVTESTADEGIEVAGHQRFQDSDDEGRDDRARQAVEAAENDDREHLEPKELDPESAARGDAPQRSRQNREHAHQAPREREVPMEVDADRHRNLLIAGYRAQGQARATAVEEPAQSGDGRDGDRGGGDLVDRDWQAAEDERVGWKRGRDPHR